MDNGVIQVALAETTLCKEIYECKLVSEACEVAGVVCLCDEIWVINLINLLILSISITV